MSISTVAQTVAGDLAGALEQVKHFVGYLAGRTVTLVRNYPGLMHEHPTVAIFTFVGVNYIVLKGSNWVATEAESNVDNKLNARLNSNRVLVKHVVVSLIVGGAAYAASAFLSKVAEYPLTRGALLTISVFAVFARYVGKAWDENAILHAEKQRKLTESNKIRAEDKAEQEAIDALDDSEPTKTERQAALDKKKSEREEAKRQAEEQEILRVEAERIAKEQAATEAAEIEAAERKQKVDDAKFAKVLEFAAGVTKDKALTEADANLLKGYLTLDMNLQEHRKATKATYQSEVIQAQEKIEGIHLELKKAIAKDDEALTTQLTKKLIEQKNEYYGAAKKLIESMA